MTKRMDPDTAYAIETEVAEREAQRRVIAGLYWRAGIYIHLSGMPIKGWALEAAADAMERALEASR